MTGVIAQVRLENRKGSSNKFYCVHVSLGMDGLVTIGTWYGPIGKRGQEGVVGAYSFNAKDRIEDKTIGVCAAKIAEEANKLIGSKTKKGYVVVSNETSISPVNVIQRLQSRISEVIEGADQEPKEKIDGAFEVEIISISGGVIRVAKVLEDYSYDVLGEAINPKRREVITGDIVRVTKKGEQLALI